MKLSAIRFITSLALTTSLLPAVVGCSAESSDAVAAGSLNLPLTARAAGGVNYRLANGTFDLTGPVNRALQGDAETSSTLVTAGLPVGSYQVTLRDGWQIQRELAGGGLLAVDAVLLSAITQTASITNGGTANVTYRFQVDDEIVELGAGQLNVNFEVETGTSSTCTAPLVDCSGVCVDLNRNPLNCGACGEVCATGNICSAGACIPAPPICTGGTTLCGSTCTNVQFDAQNCGSCGTICSASTTCQAGSCTPTTGPSVVVNLDPGGMSFLPWGPAVWFSLTGQDDCSTCAGVNPFNPLPPGPGMCMAGATTAGDVGDFSLLGLASDAGAGVPVLPPSVTAIDLALSGTAPAALRLVAFKGDTGQQTEVVLGAFAGSLNRTVSPAEFACPPGQPPAQCLDVREATGLGLFIPGGMESAPFNLCATGMTIHF